MAITKLSDSSITTGDKYISMLAGNSAYMPPSFESISSQTLASSTATITFSSIPQEYKELQVRFNAIMFDAGDVIQLRFNEDTAANYRYHMIRGNNTSVVASSVGSAQSQTRIFGGSYGTLTTYPNVGIVDIIDYASTTKYKTVRTISGANNNVAANGEINLNSGLWMSTAAVTSLTLFSGVNFNIGSTFSLYGIK